MATEAELQAQSEAPDQGQDLLSTIGGAAGAFSQGSTLGLLDEGSALVQSFFSDQSFEDLRQDSLRLTDEFSQQNPNTALGLEVAGGLIPAAITGGKVSNLTAGGGLVTRLLAQAGAAGAEGGIFGAATAEGGLEERGRGAVIPGVAGIALGPLAELGGLAVTALGRAMGDTRLGRLINGTLTAEGLTTEVLRQQKALLGPDAALADISKGVTKAAQGVVDSTPSARSLAENSLEQRAAGLPARVRSDVANLTGKTDSKNTTIGKLAEIRSLQAQPIYQKLEKEIPQNLSEKFKQRMVDTDVIKDAYSEAEKIYNTQTGQRLPPMFLDIPGTGRIVGKGMHKQEIFDQEINPALTMREWASVDQGITSLFDNRKYFDQITGRFTKQGNALNELKKDLTTALSKTSDNYVDAMEIWSMGAREIDGVEMGSKLLNMKVGDVQAATAQMGPRAKDGVLVGLTDDIRERLLNAPAGELGSLRRVRQAGLKEKLTGILSGDEVDQLVGFINREVQFNQTARQVVGGSQTAARLGASRFMDQVSDTFSALTGNPMSIARVLTKQVGGLSEDQALKLTKQMLTADGFESAMDDLIKSGVNEQNLAAIRKGFNTAGLLGVQQNQGGNDSQP